MPKFIQKAREIHQNRQVREARTFLKRLLPLPFLSLPSIFLPSPFFSPLLAFLFFLIFWLIITVNLPELRSPKWFTSGYSMCVSKEISLVREDLLNIGDTYWWDRVLDQIKMKKENYLRVNNPLSLFLIFPDVRGSFTLSHMKTVLPPYLSFHHTPCPNHEPKQSFLSSQLLSQISLYFLPDEQINC